MTESEISEFFQLGGTPRQLEQAIREGREAVKRLAESLSMTVRELKSLAARWGLKAEQLGD
ncbi:hypothetical protein ACWJKU_13240 [Methylocaldum sp. MU1018]